MISRDLHVHTTFSDGKNTPEEVVLSAIEKGIKILGFSDHSYTPFDTEYCLKENEISNYINEISGLKDKYRNKIEILCGIEQDYYSDTPTHNFDYVIGSVHYVKVGEEYIPIDNTAEILFEGVQKHFGGDIYSLIEEYYRLVGELAQKTKADIIGHFDLVTKFCEQKMLFDQNHPRYVSAFKKAADQLLKANIPFEINTGAISRGYRTSPYPAPAIKEYIKQKGGKFILSSDSHSAEALAFGFSENLLY